jgi:transposase
MKVARCGQAYKDRVVARLLPPEGSSVEQVSRAVAISVATLDRWRADALANGSGANGPDRTATARLQAVIVTAAVDEATRSAWCREQRLYPAELDAWKQDAIRNEGLSEGLPDTLGADGRMRV